MKIATRGSTLGPNNVKSDDKESSNISIHWGKKGFGLSDIKAVMLQVIEETQVSQVIENLEQLVDRINAAIENLSKGSQMMRAGVMEQKNKVDDLAIRVEKIDGQMQEVMTRQDDKGPSQSTSIMQTCLSELLEQQKKKKSIILYGVIEGPPRANDQRMVTVNTTGNVSRAGPGNLHVDGTVHGPEEDSARVIVTRIVDTAMGQLSKDIKLKTYSYQRLGARGLESKPRSIKIQFQDEKNANYIFQTVRVLLREQEKNLRLLNVSVASDRIVYSSMLV